MSATPTPAMHDDAAGSPHLATAAPPTDHPVQTLGHAALWSILGLVLLADALDLIDSTITNIAAPTIAADLGGGPGLIKWLGATYALAMGVLLVVGGRLGDKFGQRRLFLVGMAGFTLASAFAGLATGPAMLLTARVLQGAFGALLLPQGMAIMTRAFPRDLLRTAFNLFGPLLGLATVGGPVLAGFLITSDLGGLSWRPIFLINLVIGTVGVIMAARLLPRDVGDRSLTVDGLGAGLLAVTMFGLLFGLVEGSSTGWGAVAVGSVTVGLVFAALFARRQATAEVPLLKPSLLANRGFTAGMVTGTLFFAVTSGLTYVIALFMQETLHMTAGQTALGLLPLTLGIIVAAGACMALTAKLGRTLVLIAMLLTLAGAAWMLLLVSSQGTALSLWGLAPAVFVTGLGMGAGFGTIFDFALGDIDPDEAGSASGALTAVQQLASGIGSAVVTTVYFRTLDGGAIHAMSVAIVVVMVVTVFCLPAIRLLPRVAGDSQGS